MEKDFAVVAHVLHHKEIDDKNSARGSRLFVGRELWRGGNANTKDLQLPKTKGEPIHLKGLLCLPRPFKVDFVYRFQADNSARISSESFFDFHFWLLESSIYYLPHFLELFN